MRGASAVRHRGSFLPSKKPFSAISSHSTRPTTSQTQNQTGYFTAVNVNHQRGLISFCFQFVFPSFHCFTSPRSFVYSVLTVHQLKSTSEASFISLILVWTETDGLRLRRAVLQQQQSSHEGHRATGPREGQKAHGSINISCCSSAGHGFVDIMEPWGFCACVCVCVSVCSWRLVHLHSVLVINYLSIPWVWSAKLYHNDWKMIVKLHTCEEK